MKINWKSTLNYIIPVVLFLVISYTYFYPLLEGKTIFANDTNVAAGMASELAQFRKANGEEALWTNAAFAGMPAYQISTVYKGNLIKWFDKFLMPGSRPASYMFLWFLGFYVLLLAFGVNPWLSFAGALAYGFSSYFYMLTAAGHMSKVVTMGFIPLVFAGIILAFKGKRLLGAGLFGVSLSLMLNANHPQIAYYGGLSVMVLGLVYLIFAFKEKDWVPFLKTAGALLVAFMLALGTNYGRISTNASYAKHTMRGKAELTPVGARAEGATSGLDKEYIWKYSYGISETFSIMIPNFMGGVSKPLPVDGATVDALKAHGVKDAKKMVNQLPRAYWGPQEYVAGPAFFGAIICFLFVLGLFLVKGKDKWWILAVTIFGLLLSWGKHVPGIAGFFIDHFPLFNKFRDMSMMMVIPQFSMPILAALALKSIYDEKPDGKSFNKALLWSFGLTGGLSLLFALFPSLAGDFYVKNPAALTGETNLAASNSWLMEAIVQDRQALLKADAFRSFFFVLLAAAAVWAWVNQKLKLSYFMAAISVLVLIEMMPVDKRFLNDENFVAKRKAKTPYPPSKADQAILRDKDPNYKVLNLTVSPFNDATTSMHHKSIGGYHGAKLQRYQDMIERHIYPEIQALSTNLKSAKSMKDVFGNTKVLNMLNTKYVITNPNGSPLYNTEAYGNAWTINAITMVENADEEITKLKNINPRYEAVVDKRFVDEVASFKADTFSNANIKLTAYAPNKLKYAFSSDKTEAVIFSEIYYADGWNAYIDGEPVDYFRANYILRGLIVPAGKHEIEFNFHPQEYYSGNKISLVSSLLLLLVFFGTIGMEIKKTKA